MKKYKLIKKYPSLPSDWEVGMIVGLGDRCTPTSFSPCNAKYKDYYVPYQEVVNNPEFWQEIIEYPVGTKIIDKTREKGWNELIKLKDGTWERVSFTREIIDESEIGKGKRFEVIEERKPLFVSEDNVEIFEDDEVYFIYLPLTSATKQPEKSKFKKEYLPNPGYRLVFSSKEKAEEYIILNKPCISINDLIKEFPNFSKFGDDLFRIKRLVKSKLKFN